LREVVEAVREAAPVLMLPDLVVELVVLEQVLGYLLLLELLIR
jgi:hypothetical protein